MLEGPTFDLHTGGSPLFIRDIANRSAVDSQGVNCGCRRCFLISILAFDDERRLPCTNTRLSLAARKRLRAATARRAYWTRKGGPVVIIRSRGLLLACDRPWCTAANRRTPNQPVIIQNSLGLGSVPAGLAKCGTGNFLRYSTKMGHSRRRPVPLAMRISRGGVLGGTSRPGMTKAEFTRGTPLPERAWLGLRPVMASAVEERRRGSRERPALSSSFTLHVHRIGPLVVGWHHHPY